MNSDPTPKSGNNSRPPEDLNDIPMVDDDFREHVDKIYDAREVIAEALWDNTFYDYAVHRGQIEIKDVDPRIRHSQAFQDFVAEFGWPDAKDDNGIELPNIYDSNDEPDYDAFLDAFLSRSKDAEGKPDLVANLDNFRLWLLKVPSDQPYSPEKGLEQVYAAHPALHRLYALMPELMSAVHELVKDIHDRHVGEINRFPVSGFADEMSADVNGELVKAIYLIYQVAGRLLKTDDRQRQHEILRLPPAKSVERITNAHEELRT